MKIIMRIIGIIMVILNSIYILWYLSIIISFNSAIKSLDANAPSVSPLLLIIYIIPLIIGIVLIKKSKK